MAVISIWCKNIIFELKMTVIIRHIIKAQNDRFDSPNDRSVIPDNRGKFGFENAVDIDQSERFLW